jgi:hypothetical protein
VFLVDDDQTRTRERCKHRGARADHDRCGPGLRGAPGLQPLEIGERGMQHGERCTKARGEALDELRRQGDLGNEHERLLPACDDALDRAQIDLGLAAAGDPAQQELRIRSRGAIDRLDGLALGVEQGGSGRGDDRTRDGGGSLLDSRDPPATLELAHVVAPPVGPGGELRLGDRRSRGQQVDELTQPMGAHGDRRQFPHARRRAQRVDSLHVACGAPSRSALGSAAANTSPSG